jgi:predicted Rossmann-fold nucleotide-binding protein
MILFGKEFWSGILEWMQTQMLERNKFISPDDLDLFTVTDDPREAVEIVMEYLRRVGPPDRVPKAFS